ncbi:MAG: ribokinase [Chloroflexi bacterium]|nr:ribokinase [Chloroflexota bacterium]
MTTLETRTGGKIAVVGGLNMDLFIQGERLPHPGETFEGRSFSTGGGGKGANQAVGVARLARVRGTAVMIGQVGDDGFGRELVSSMEAEGIGCEFTRIDESQSSGVALIFIDDTAENYVLPVYGANATCGPQQVSDFVSIVRNVSVLLAQQEISMDVTLECMRAARNAGVTVVLDPAPVRESPPDEFLELVHVVTPNQNEAEALTGVKVRDVKSAEKAALELRKRGTPVAVVKLGEEGAYVASLEFEGYFPPFKVTPVATVAAGDAFNAGLAVGLTEGMGIQDAVWLAMASGAVCVSNEGAQESMGQRADIDALLATRPR